MDLFAACLPGLEPLLEAELPGLGVAAALRRVPGGVEWQGRVEDRWRVNLGSGLVTHLLQRVARFPVRHVAQLRDRAEDLPWTELLDPARPFAVEARCSKSKLYHSGAVEQRVRDGIRARLGIEGPSPEQSRGDADAVPVRVRLHRDVCTISVDTSGDPLHRRGWRLAGGKAPLREDLAHALVLASGWDRQSPLLDPFCGSGTIALEAAAIARGLAPGRLRRFAFERMVGFADADYRSWRAGWESERAREGDAPVFGSDRDAGVVQRAQQNAERAGLTEAVQWQHAALRAAPGWELLREQVGAVVTNPPYGRRVGESDRLGPLYQSLGRELQGCASGTRVALLGSDRRLALRTGLPLETAFLTQHGGLSVRALATGLKS